MKPPVDTIRLNKKARDQLIKLKRQTGIEHWNIMCRWALCLSLRDQSMPPPTEIEKGAAVEIDWKTFAGEQDEVIGALLRTWTKSLTSSRLDDAEVIKRHIQRGLSIMDALRLETIDDLVQVVKQQTSR